MDGREKRRDRVSIIIVGKKRSGVFRDAFFVEKTWGGGEGRRNKAKSISKIKRQINDETERQSHRSQYEINQKYDIDPKYEINLKYEINPKTAEDLIGPGRFKVPSKVPT